MCLAALESVDRCWFASGTCNIYFRVLNNNRYQQILDREVIYGNYRQGTAQNRLKDADYSELNTYVRSMRCRSPAL